MEEAGAPPVQCDDSVPGPEQNSDTSVVSEHSDMPVDPEHSDMPVVPEHSDTPVVPEHNGLAENADTCDNVSIDQSSTDTNLQVPDKSNEQTPEERQPTDEPITPEVPKPPDVPILSEPTSEQAGTSEQGGTDPTVSSEERENGSASGALIKCVLCDVGLSKTDRPMLLECLHSACASCIDAKIHEQPDQDVLDSNAVLCPWCSITSDRTNLIDDRFVLEGSSGAGTSSDTPSSEEEVCVSCEENIVASSFCEDCAELLCDTCVQAHRRVRVTKDHVIVEKGQAKGRAGTSNDGGITDLRCSTHPAESLSLFCEKCDQLTCRDCQLTEHREHRFKFVNEIAADARRSLSALLGEVTYKRGLLESAVKVIDKRQAAINEKKQQVVTEITKLVMLLTNAIKGRGKQLVQRLGEVCENKQRTLAEKRMTLQQLTRLTDHCISAVTGQLDTGSDLALLWSKKTIMRHLQRIKCRRADIPNPDIPVRIHFAQQRVDTLCNALATVGGIVVDGKAYPHAEDNKPSRSPVLQLPTNPHPVLQQTQQLQQHNQHNHHAQLQHQQQQQQHQQQQQQQLQQQQQQMQQQQQQQQMQQQQTLLTVHHRPTPHHHQQIRPHGNSHQVSSSTHPGAQQLRTLLAPSLHMRPGAQLPSLRPLNYPPPPPPQQPVQIRMPGVRMPMQPRPPPPLTPATSIAAQGQSRAPVWHIPPGRPTQHMPNPQPPVNDNFRITLTNHWLPTSEQVSSSGTQRSTPSPAAASGRTSADAALDSFCQKSMDELFSTIANMNAGKGEASTSSLVDSSTGSPSQVRPSIGPVPQEVVSPVKDDPNDDWCAVCMDGGDLVCCDRCPKVFHTHCHIPQLGSIEETPDSWQCLLCTPVSEILQTALPLYEEGAQKMNIRELKTAQRLLLELYCQYDHSQPFREPVSVITFPEYPRVVEHPMSLDIIKRRLEPGKEDSYVDLQHFVNDVRLIFKNAYIFNPKGTAVYNEAQALEHIFERMISKWAPAYTSTNRLHPSNDDAEDDGPGKRKKPRIE